MSQLVKITAEEYFADEAVGRSDLWTLLNKSPAHYKANKETPRKETPALVIGHAVHAAILEPDLYGSDFAVFDEAQLEGSLQSLDDYKVAADALGIKVGKMRKEELKAAIKAADTESKFVFREDKISSLYDGKTVLSQEDGEMIKSVMASVKESSGASLVLQSGVAEMSVFWTDPDTGIKVKVRPDFVMTDLFGNIIGIADVKTTEDASPNGFKRSIEKYGYDMQAALYTDGMATVTGKELPFFFVAVEKKAPYAVAVYRADEKMLEAGRNSTRGYKAALSLLSWCRDNHDFPSYQGFQSINSLDQIETISLPSYALSQAEVFAEAA